MASNNLIITIPEPCHENWNNMHPDEKGRFCNSCQKSVYDFSNKTNDEILYVLNEKKAEKVCGRFRVAQVNKPICYTINLQKLPKHISFTKAFTIAILIAFGTMLVSCTDESGKKVDSIELANADKVDNIMGFSIPQVIPEQSDSGITEIVSQADYIVGAMSWDPHPPVSPLIDSTIMETDSVIYKKSEEVYSVMGGIGSYYIVDETVDSIRVDSNSLSNKLIPTTLDPKSDFQFGVYPNPSNGVFNVKYEVLKPSDVSITIYDLTGKIVQSVVQQMNQHAGNYIIPVSLSNLSNGIYICKIVTSEKEKAIKFVVEN